MKPHPILLFVLMAPLILNLNSINLNSTHITITGDTITWNYTETLTGNESIQYKTKIDQTLGNNDSYLAAWELLLTDQQARKTLKNQIQGKVKINGSNATLKDVDTTLSLEALGNTTTPTQITNKYKTQYTYNRDNKTTLLFQFLGKPQTKITITLPPNTTLQNTSGIQNLTQKNKTTLTGFFTNQTGNESEITLKIHWPPTPQETDNTTVTEETSQPPTTSPRETGIFLLLVLMLLVLGVLFYKILTKAPKN